VAGVSLRQQLEAALVANEELRAEIERLRATVAALELVAEMFLFPYRDRWFGPAPA
jgi:hypothetical protein